MFIPKNPLSVVQRILFEATLTLSLLRLVPLARKQDAVMVFCPQVANLVAALFIKVLFRKPIWLNLQDLVSSAAGNTGIASVRLSRLAMRMEAWLYNFCDVWSTISPVMRDRAEGFRRRDQPFLIIPNWSDKPLIDALARTLRKDRKPGMPLKLLYAGNVGAKQDLLRFCQILGSSNANFTFAINVSGASAQEVINWISSSGDSRFTTGPFLNVEDLALKLKAADFYVITEKDSIAASFFPSKVVVSMNAGTPILAICDGGSPLGQEMKEASPGLQIEWKDIGKLPITLDRLTGIEGIFRFQIWRENALKRAAFYDRQDILNRLHQALEKFLAGKPVPISPKKGDIP